MFRSSIAIRINGSVIITILLAIGFLTLLIHRADVNRSASIEALQSLTAQQLLARKLQVDFKKQVQEWKNVLLRGHERKDFDKYKSKFLSQQMDVRMSIDQLLASGLPDETFELLDVLRTEHAQLGSNYLEAMEAFKANDNDFRMADNQVRGQDRPPTDRMDTLVESFDVAVSDLLASQTLAARQEQYLLLAMATTIFILIAAALAWYLSRQIVKPLKALSRVAQTIGLEGGGEPIPYCKRGDEVGALAQSLNEFRSKQIELDALRRSAIAATEIQEKQEFARLELTLHEEREAASDLEKKMENDLLEATIKREEQLRQRLSRLSQAVAAAARGNLGYLAANPDSGEKINDDLGRMTCDLESLFSQFDQDFDKIARGSEFLHESAEKIGALSDHITSDAKENTENTQQVLKSASSVREAIDKMSEDIAAMAQGIGSVETSASKASSVAGEAVLLGQSTDATIRKLSASSADIGNVIKLINSVAEQTNLLALNATIEAARAGDAGKGFAVVANEVKELAKETNKATGEIQQRISAIRKDTDQAVEAIGNINTIVSQINEIQDDISASVKTQSRSADGIMELVETTLANNTSVRNLMSNINDRQVHAQASAEKVREASCSLRESAADSLALTSRYTA
ncbi:MAG: methyl-accepting chemotaxis protein [Granulosicoccus sp.]